ncbi:hypothetical protein Pcinc_027924 [Petrolisthes cinctipes]|uniref:Uncharacterized protein n=1 Tax=Petrolisthes cinctipes TaxID=88211 RepID=A0AAE1F406_PETCI|nr:hypothetical protein Pcinc_027924 [Petrolisthes cinctipes]
MTSTIKKIFVVLLVLAAHLCKAVAMTTTTTKEPPRLTKEGILIEAQREALRNNCCRLVNTTTDYLENLDLFNDALHPKVIAVSRCQGFCGSVKLGETRGTCMPDVGGVKEREVAMYELKGGKEQYSLVKVAEHTSCRCC